MYGAWLYLSYLWDLEFRGAKRWHLGWQCKPQVGDEPILVEKVVVVVKGGRVFLICNNAGLKLYCKSYWVLQKIL